MIIKNYYTNRYGLNKNQLHFNQKGKLRTKYFIGLCIAVIGLTVLSLYTGAYDIQGNVEGWRMFFITRLPRTVALILSGAALSMSGLVMQLLTQNRFVEPSTTGTVEWAGLGLIVAHLIFPIPSILARMTVAILFSFFGMMIYFIILRKVQL